MSDKGFSGRGSKSGCPGEEDSSPESCAKLYRSVQELHRSPYILGLWLRSCLSSWSCVDENRSFRPAMPFAQASMVSSL